MVFDDPFAEGEANAGAGVFLFVVEALEDGKHFVSIDLVESDPIIFKSYFGVFA